MANAQNSKSKRQRDFKVLARNQALMVRLGLSSDRLTESSNVFFKSFVPYFNFTFLSINLLFCAMVIVQSFPDLDLVLEPLIVFIGGMQGGGMFLSVGLNIENVRALYLAVQKIVQDEREQHLDFLVHSFRTNRIHFFITFSNFSFHSSKVTTRI